ncbi:MAG: RDD family protein [Verrucomicrobiota bacterium]
MEKKPVHLPYAGFWSRAAARIIDVLLIVAAYNLVYVVDRFGAGAGLWAGSGLAEGDVDGGLSLANALRALFFLGFPIFYYVYLTGSCGQTFGKMALKIKVINEDGTTLDYRKAFLRWLGYFLCDLTFNIGYIWAAFDSRKQGLHDKVCKTLVIRTDVPPPPAPEKQAAVSDRTESTPPRESAPAAPLDTRSEPPI